MGESELEARALRGRVRICGLALALWLLAAWAVSCRPAPSAAPGVSVFVTFPSDLPLSTRDITFSPPGHVRAARLDRTHVLSLESDGQAFEVGAKGTCPTLVPQAEPGTLLRLEAAPLLDFGPRYVSQVGYDANVELRVRPRCAAARDAQVTWRQVEGPAPRDIQVFDRGRRISLRTLPLSHFFPDGLRAGVVAISPRSQGRYVFEARARAAAVTLQRRVTVTSAARATGLASFAVSQRVLLGSPGLSVRAAPRGSQAQVEQWAGAASFAPDVAGRYTLADDAGSKLELQALTHDRTPLDCGRGECHARETAAAAATAMNRALGRLAGSHPLPSAAACALECHVVGEAGLHDGGFLDVADSMRFADLHQTPISELPTQLRRLAGVGCSSCHGPGAIPPATARARILRVDVCATCHDAPPAYAHVADWKRSRMAHADRDQRARTGPRCARCHTTGGFLAAIGVRPRADLSRDPDGEEVGIACAACHAPHGAQRARALVRATEAAASLAAPAQRNDEVSALCTQCHAPGGDETGPSASSAALWLGKVRVPEALGGGVLEGPAPHADLEGGCMSCHGASAQPGRRATQHSFAVDGQRCSQCHARAQEPERAERLRERALQLLTAVDAACAIGSDRGVAPPHAAVGESSCRGSASLARARYAVLLVAEDPAASAHNLPFAEQLLEQAQRALSPR